MLHPLLSPSQLCLRQVLWKSRSEQGPEKPKPTQFFEVWCVYRGIVKSLLIRRCSQEPHPPSWGPVPCLGPPGAWPDFRSHPGVWWGSCWRGALVGLGCETSSLPSPRGCYHHSPRCFHHISCASAVSGPSYIFQNVFSIISWAWTFCSCCKTASKLRTISASFTRGYWDHRLPEAGTNAFLLSAGESQPSFPVKPQQFANQRWFVHFHLSRDLLFQLKKNHVRIKLSPHNLASGYLLQPFLLSRGWEEAVRRHWELGSGHRWWVC